MLLFLFFILLFHGFYSICFRALEKDILNSFPNVVISILKLVKKLAKTYVTIMGSVFITLILVGAGGYFGLPLLFPNLNEDLSIYLEEEDLDGYLEEEDLDGYTKTEDLNAEGIILQTKNNESQTAANIFWNVFAYEKIPDTGLNITTSGNSKLNVVFDGALMLRLGSTFMGDTKYNITLDILGVGNRTTAIYAGINSALGTDWEVPCNTHIFFETGILPAGTYSISIFWSSAIAPAAGWSQLFVLDEYPRSIYVQEIAG